MNILQYCLNLFKSNPEPYQIPFEEFYKSPPSIAKTEIMQLIERYGIKNKEIISVGAGSAFEEYWFAKEGNNNLTMVDIDEHNSLEKFLQPMALKQGKRVSSKVIEYFIGDFLKFNPKVFSGKFDVLYYSGFTPDELRRGAIMNKAQKRSGSKRKNAVDLNWFESALPLHPVVESSLTFLKSKSFFILQSYCSGIDLHYNPSYIKNLKKQLLVYGLRLIDIYSFIESPAVNLFVAYKGDEKETEEMYAKIKNTEIETFHGRAAIDNTAKKIYAYGAA